MFTPGSGIFIQVPGKSKQRVLHPAKVTAVENSIHTAELGECCPTLEPGQSIFVYFEIDHQFMQQPARVDAILEAEPHPMIGFETTGDPVSAESRQCYRVSTVMADLTALVNDEECPLLDVSATGFAVLSTARHPVGSVVKITLGFKDKNYSGQARIQSIREMSDGRSRYGFNAVDDKAAGGNLHQGQRDITMEVQRQQLRRLARG